MTVSRRQFLVTAALLPTSLVVAGTARAATHDVTISGFAFSPASLTIAVGDTVRFTNQDGASHTATFANGGPDTGRLRTGESGEVTLATRGTHAYVCAYHSSMRGTITVT